MSSLLLDQNPQIAPLSLHPLETRRFQGIPGIEASPEGDRLWATWYAGGADLAWEGPGNFVVMATSTDRGENWEELHLIADPNPEMRVFDPCLWRDPNGRLWLFFAVSGLRAEPKGVHSDGRAGVWALWCDDSHQARPQWSAPVRISDGIMMNKPTVRSNGEWLLPVAIWHPSVGSFVYDPGDQVGAWVLVTADNGASWTMRGRAVAHLPTYDEHQVLERRDGSLWMLIRTKQGVEESVSHDGGLNWTEPQLTPLQQTSSRFFLRRLASGRVLLVQHGPPPEEKTARSHLYAQLSEDDGMSWGPGLLLDERLGISYPDGIELADGTLFIIYDRERVKAGDILLARCREADLLAGELTCPGSALKLPVSSMPVKPTEPTS